MHGEPSRLGNNYANNGVVVAIDDTDMDNENENNISGSGVGGGGGGNNGGMSGIGGGGTSSMMMMPHHQQQHYAPFSSSSTTSAAGASYNPDFEVNNSSIDLDMYVSGFSGLMRINRLLFLAEHCPMLRLDALRLALNYVMETFNTQMYISIHKQLSDAFSKL